LHSWRSIIADYFFPTLMPLERLVLEPMFDAEPVGDGLYLFTDAGPP
jgi:hypothetical protein